MVIYIQLESGAGAPQGIGLIISGLQYLKKKRGVPTKGAVFVGTIYVILIRKINNSLTMACGLVVDVCLSSFLFFWKKKSAFHLERE